MLRKTMLLATVAGLALLLAASAVEAKPLKTTITLTQPVMVGDTRLEPGDYRVEADDSRVVFRRGREVVAERAASWRELEVAPRSSGVVLREGRIIEVRFSGQTRALALES